MINVLLPIFEAAGINFATRKNSYGITEFRSMMASMLNRSSTAEATGNRLQLYKNAPSGKWFRNMIHSIDENAVGTLCNALLEHAVNVIHSSQKMARGRKYVAIDKHLKPRYNYGNMEYLIRSQPKSGTTKFEAYATIQVVAGTINAVLDCFRVVSESENVDFVREFVQNLEERGILAHLLLIDREFYAVEIMKALAELKKDFIMPAVKRDGIKNAILEYHRRKRKAVSRYTMTNKNGESFTFTLIIKKAKKKEKKDTDKKISKEKAITDKYVVFATNIPLQRAIQEVNLIPKEYKKRWGVETAYRQVEEICPWTTSRNADYRRILFYTSLCMFNMWAIERIKLGTRQKMLTLELLTEIVFALLFNTLEDDPQCPFDRGRSEN